MAKSPGQQRERWDLNAEDVTPLNGFASRGGQGSSDENQGLGTLVSGAVDPHERWECPVHSNWDGDTEAVRIPAPFHGPTLRQGSQGYFCSRVCTSNPPPS